MNELKRFHEQWLGLVQPVDGLVVTALVLAELGVGGVAPAEVVTAVREVVRVEKDGGVRVGLLELLLAVGIPRDVIDVGEELPEEFLVPGEDAGTFVRATLGVRAGRVDMEPAEGLTLTAVARQAWPWGLLALEVSGDVDLDKPEVETSAWAYPVTAKLDRLLRHCRVPMGLVSNGRQVRVLVTPWGEPTGSLTFPVDAMVRADGVAVLHGFHSLLGPQALFSEGADTCTEGIFRAARLRQGSVSTRLAAQALYGVECLLAGFEAAAGRQPDSALGRALREGLEDGDGQQAGADEVYSGLLITLLRLVFVLFAEDRGLMPMEDPVYAQGLSVRGLFEELERDAARFPDAMDRRFGAWPRLLALFRGIYRGFGRGAQRAPARQGELFDPDRYPFLEGREAVGSGLALDQSAMTVPMVDDGTVLEVLRALCRLDGQRLSYRSLAVEQIGSVYEGLMGWRVERLEGAGLRLPKSGLWVTGEMLMRVPAGARKSWLRTEMGLPNADAGKVADAVGDATDSAAILAALRAWAGERVELRAAGRLVLQPGAERRRTSAHYTPREMSERIVRRTLEPLLSAMGEQPSSERLLQLRLVDPAMGSGAFLVEACRQLGDLVVQAWSREGVAQPVLQGGGHDEAVVHKARRLVAQRCLYGVDVNPHAVTLAKLSLWLFTLARHQPFTFLDHALRHGDSLVGLDMQQIVGLSWSPSEQYAFMDRVVAGQVQLALQSRRQIHELANVDTAASVSERRELLQKSEEAMERVQVVADVVLGAFIGSARSAEREKERRRRVGVLTEWLAGGEAEPGPTPEPVRRWREELRAWRPAFHWPLCFPEVFADDRADVLDADRVHAGARFDAVIGNPPFLGGSSVSGTFGPAYRDWLPTLHQNSHGNADLCAHFFRRAMYLLGDHGAMGLVATNTIAQGDTRETGLDALVAQKAEIYDATTDVPWGGDAAVTVSIVHLAVGRCKANLVRLRNGQPVQQIDAYLQSGESLGTPTPLRANAGKSFLGVKIYGQGFTLTPAERDELIAKNPNNAKRIFPYLGGQEVNTHPEQMFDRYVIDFADMTLDQVRHWPDLLERVERLVKPERDKNNRATRREKWWQFAENAPAMREALADKDRVLVTARVSRNLCFSYQPAGRVCNEKLYSFLNIPAGLTAVLQSRLHEIWVWTFSSTLKTDLNYSATDVFETFPFPDATHLREGGPLEVAGRAYYEARAAWMKRHWLGLTQFYNRLKDPKQHDPELKELRQLHEAMDRETLLAYGWPDLAAALPPYASPPDDPTFVTFKTQVLERLYALNQQRAAEEARAEAELIAAGGKVKGGGKGAGKVGKKVKGGGDGDEGDGSQGVLV